MNDTSYESWEYLAREAIEIQDACNISGLSRRFVHVVNNVRCLLADETTSKIVDTDRLNQHPIIKLWTSKLHSLSRMGLSDLDAYSSAYDWCKRKADGSTEEAQDE